MRFCTCRNRLRRSPGRSLFCYLWERGLAGCFVTLETRELGPASPPDRVLREEFPVLGLHGWSLDPGNFALPGGACWNGLVQELGRSRRFLGPSQVTVEGVATPTLAWPHGQAVFGKSLSAGTQWGYLTHLFFPTPEVFLRMQGNSAKIGLRTGARAEKLFSGWLARANLARRQESNFGGGSGGILKNRFSESGAPVRIPRGIGNSGTAQVCLHDWPGRLRVKPELHSSPRGGGTLGLPAALLAALGGPPP